MFVRKLISTFAAFAAGLVLHHASAAQDSGAEPAEFNLDIYDLDDEWGEESPLVSDPFEGFNRRMFAFNDGLDRVVLTPVLRGYRFLVPPFGRNRIRDFIDNLKTPVWFVNETLQGDFNGAGTQAARFGLNSTIGVAGFYDFADAHAGLTKHDEDFGQTLAVYDVGNGPYLVLPLLGPSTTRDLTGRVVDGVFDPLNWTEFQGVDALRYSTSGADVVDGRERADEIIQIMRSGLDPYVETRTLYIQARNARLAEDWRDATPPSVDEELERYDDF